MTAVGVGAAASLGIDLYSPPLTAPLLPNWHRQLSPTSQVKDHYVEIKNNKKQQSTYIFVHTTTI